MIGDDTISKEAFVEFGNNAARAISMRNALYPATEVTEILEEA